jgi:hypothetical protein
MTFKERIKEALHNDNSIVVPIADMQKPEFKHVGFSVKYMSDMGLKKSDLKKLEKAGLAVRSYTKNYWGPGETLPNGKVVDDKSWYNGRGHLVRWLLITPTEVKV